MNKKQLFDLIVEKAAEVCNVPTADIEGQSRQADVVDARCLVFRFAVNEAGFTFRDIASALGRRNPVAIRQLYHSYDNRSVNFCFRELSNTLHKLLLPELKVLENR